MKRVRKFIRIVWPLAGLSFLLWLFYSSQSRGFPESILQSDLSVSVSETADDIRFIPNDNNQAVGLVFYPGGMIEPRAYAPMARQIAEAGFNVFIVKLPFRLAYLDRQEGAVFENSLDIMNSHKSVQNWVVGGHSRGGAIATHFAHIHADTIAALLLIGTSHPKDESYDLATFDLDVTKIYATNDGLASVLEIRETSRYLPPDTTWIEIEGGNHAQFGYYGSQLGDEPAEISREEQHEIMVAAILDLLKRFENEG